MIKIKILSVGKTKEKWLAAALPEYEKRLKGQIEFDYQWLKNEERLIAEATRDFKTIGLDPQGELMDSQKFASFFEKSAEGGGAKLTFVIGGAEGLPPVLRQNLPLVSLSSLTFTHQLTRLVLVEQIYRAFTLIRKIPYHK